MFVIYDAIRLDAIAKSIEIFDEDWAINPKAHGMQHQPTGTVYEIRVDEKPTEGSLLTAMDFSARLVAIRSGSALPSEETIKELGQTAIALYLVAMGFTQTGPEDSGGQAPPGLPPAPENLYAS
jgi:hypothetical protein